MKVACRAGQLAITVTLALWGLGAPAQSTADPGAQAYPGMLVWQGPTVCTLGFVEPSRRLALTTGHCDGQFPVTDSRGQAVGSVVVARHNRTDTTELERSTLATEYEVMALAPTVTVSDVLPTGRPLQSAPSFHAQSGLPVCQFSTTTGQRCGRVGPVSGGRFVMTEMPGENGGCDGPVYVLTDDNRATVVGLCDGVAGSAPQAESWQAVMQQLYLDTRDLGPPQLHLVGRTAQVVWPQNPDRPST